jgi:hypothetical protein
MEMPNYLDYGKMYEMNPGAFWQAQNQVGLAQQFQDQKLAQEQEVTKQKNLANLFTEQNDPLRLENQRISNEKLGFETSDAGVKSRINKATEGLQLDQAQRDFVTKAKKSDLDQMELVAQQMAYSQNPQERSQGESLLKMHRDFVKIREEGKIRADEGVAAGRRALDLERMRAGNQRSLEQLRIDAGKYNKKNSGTISSINDALRSGKLTYERAAVLMANEAAGADDPVEQQRFLNMARMYEEMNLRQKTAGVQGKVDVGATTGLPTQQVAPVIPPQGQPQQQAPAAAPRMALSQLKQMYPNKSEQELKAAWKRKYGVDVQ